MSSASRIAPPRASAMIESLRGLGYSTETAIADLVDNCISAGASRIDIQFNWAESQSSITILDNGAGMTDGQLERALTLGGRSPTEVRDRDDLGRFGFGLKTASFSQGRCLTVASKTESSSLACLRWDLEQMEHDRRDDWLLFEGPRNGSENFLKVLASQKCGTLVLWEALDKIVTSKFSIEDFLHLIDRVERHLSAVFTYFLSRSSVKIAILVNGKRIEAWDPFMENNVGTWGSPIETIPTSSGQITFRGFVLPHRDKLNAREIELGAGERGWNGQQGFYVFRNQRLLVAGTWLGLGDGKQWTKEEPFRLARIRLDISNRSDADWKIDIRKSTARVPAEVRDRLTLLAADVRDRARKVFAFRGAGYPKRENAELQSGWITTQNKDGVTYRVNRDNPLISSAIETLSVHGVLFEAVLKLIENTVPVQKIWLDTAEAKDTPKRVDSTEATPEVVAMLETFYRDLVRRRGLAPEEARKRLLSSEPFCNFPREIAAIDDI